MNSAQTGILQPIPNHARYLCFSIHDPAHLSSALRTLQELTDGKQTVAALGQTLIAALGARLGGLKNAPLLSAPGLSIDPIPEALWLWLRGDDRGDILHRSLRLCEALSPAFTLSESWDAFKHGDGRDLTGYEDGTENPTGEDASRAALVSQEHAALEGSSFVAVQRWLHHFARFEAMPVQAQDHAIGRRRSDNEELDEAPESAHVKRTAQENFSPEAFVLRRSMPWLDGNKGGLMFVAFGHSFDAFEAQLKRMIGAEDGIVDALFGFTRPISVGYYWCPAIKDGKLNLTPLGL